MSVTDSQLLLATEIVPPPEAGGQAATRLAREHQERAGDVAEAHRGAVLVRVGRGCVSRFADLDDALAAAAALLQPSVGERGPRGRLKMALHRGGLGAGEVPLADPAVATARQLLGVAGPGEIVLSEGLKAALRDRGLQTAPIPGPAEGTSPPQAHRLLTRPRPPTDPRDRPLPGWSLGLAVAVAVLAAVGTIVATLLQ